jgi:2-hydroxy-3-oxopropionate reductase
MKPLDSVAVIGLGVMGLPIVNNLLKAGVTVEVWNRSEPAILRAEEAGAIRLNSLSETSAKIVLTVLPDIKEVREVLDNGLASALTKECVLVVMGTVSPVAMATLADELAKKEIRILDAPMSGGDIGAIEGTLSIMVGGDLDSYLRVLPIFEKIGKTIRLLGPVGSGQIAKACNQVVVAITLTALGEAVTLARRSGLNAHEVLDLLSGGLANSQALKIKREKIESGDFSPGGYSKFQLKDLNFALESANGIGVDLPVTSIVRQLFSDLVEHGDGELDHSAIIREIERRAEFAINETHAK